MRAVPLLQVRREWWCPNCTVLDVTNRADAHVQMHPCAGLGGLLSPMLERHERAHVYAVEREDYVGQEQGLRYANGRPIMATHKITDDSDSCWVYAGVAVAERED